MEVTNRFKELDLIDRVPDELWTEVRDVVQETGIKTIIVENNTFKRLYIIFIFILFPANWFSSYI